MPKILTIHLKRFIVHNPRNIDKNQCNIEIPIDSPHESRIVSSPAVFADPETGVLGGLWIGGDHGDDTEHISE